MDKESRRLPADLKKILPANMQEGEEEEPISISAIVAGVIALAW